MTSIEQINSSEYLIAYLDVLGTKSKMCSKNKKWRDSYLSILNHFIDQAKNGFGTTENLATNLDCVVFSDNILIAYDIKKANDKEELIKECKNLVLYVMCLQNQAYPSGFFLRGAIQFGELYIDKEQNFVCGKGLVDAYAQESSLAVYPRIISTDENLIGVIDNIPVEGTIFESIFKEDFDDISYLNFLTVFKDKTLNNIKVIESMNKKYSSDFMEERTNEKIIQKHDWFINYFNNFCDENELERCKINIEDLVSAK